MEVVVALLSVLVPLLLLGVAIVALTRIARATERIEELLDQLVRRQEPPTGA